jgi:hypothetical protein
MTVDLVALQLQSGRIFVLHRQSLPALIALVPSETGSPRYPQIWSLGEKIMGALPLV